jgi:hypothetical protein
MGLQLLSLCSAKEQAKCKDTEKTCKEQRILED